MNRKLLLSFMLFASLIGYAQNTFVFFGSYNRDKTSEGIFVYELDTIKGKLTKVSAVKNVLNPSFLSLSADGKYVFACTDTRVPNGGTVSSFKFDPKAKSLSLINSQKSGGENPVYITAHKNGKWLVNGNYNESSISVYPVSEDGKISPFVQHFKFDGGSIHPERQQGSHIHSTVFSPNFDYLFAPDLGSDKIRKFTFNENQSEPLQLDENANTKVVPGSGPRHFTFHPNGKFAYLIEELTGTISSFNYDNGNLTPLERVDTHSEKRKDNFESSDLHFSPDGRFLYASNRGSENNIAIFSVQNNGTLKTIGYQSTLGKHPRVFGLDESGKFLIATNAVSGDAVVFKRNAETGLLKKVGKKIKIKSVSSVQIRKY